MNNTKIRRYISLPRILALLGLILLVVISFQHPLYAQNMTQGYDTEQPLQRGLIIQLDETDTTKIKPVSQNTMDAIHGVVVDPNDAPVTLSTEGQKTFVATVGQFDVLVSTQNGTVAAGDYITVSAIDGIGMRAGTEEPFIIGRALGNYDGSSAIYSTDITDSNGTSRSVAIGRVSVDIQAKRNPLLKAEEPNLPEFLRRASEAIAGKPVNPVRVYIGLVIFIVATVVAASLLYAGIRSAITAIGRNPLSKKSVMRGMMQVILTGLIIFISGLLGVYLLLKI